MDSNVQVLSVNELIKLRGSDLNLIMARVNTSLAVVNLLRTTQYMNTGIGAPVEHPLTQFERGAYNACWETLRQWVSGELSADPVSDDDLPGPDMATRLPRVSGPPGQCAPPEMVHVGDLVTNH